jgi:hypothetical protein
MTERNVMAVVTDLVKSGLSVEQTILVNELVMLTATLQADADQRAYERERKRAYRDKAGQSQSPPHPLEINILIKPPLPPKPRMPLKAFTLLSPRR